MRIEMNPAQYRSLVELVHAGAFMFSSAAGADGVPDETYAETESFLLSHAKDFESGDLAQQGADRGGHYASSLLEDSVNEIIDVYDEDVFWGELTERLAERDFIREYGELAVEKMNATERYELSLPYYDKYEEAFGKSGVDGLELVKKS